MKEEMILTEDITPTVVDNTHVFIGVKRKSDDGLFAMTEEEYQKIDKEEYAVDGIIIRNEEMEADLLYAPYEVDAIFGEGPEDIPETDKRRKNANPNPIFRDLDGEERTAWQLNYHHDTHEAGCAICEAVKFGWLPSGGEMNLLSQYLEDFNAKAELCGAEPVGENMYWLSTQYSEEYMWAMDMAKKTFEFWHSKATTMKVRPVKSASDYIETVKEDVE